LCRYQGPINITDTEKQLVGSQLSAALITIESVLNATFLPLDADQRQTAKIYRSAVQFLVDDFRHLNFVNIKGNSLSERLKELLNDGPVESLDWNLVGWQDNTALGKFTFNMLTIDITGVLNNHTWWNENDRTLK